MDKLFLSSFKRWLAALTLVVGVASSANADVTIDGVTYTLTSSSNTATVSGYTSAMSKNVVIPESITSGGTSYSVTTIAQSAFDGCTKMESISIPASVTQIGEYKYSNYYPNVSSNRDYYYSTFKGCYNLKKIRFEDGTSTLKLGYTYYSSSSSYGRGMFADCSIEEIYLGRNISYIDTNYKFSTSNANNFGYSAFYNHTTLTTVTIGSKVTTLPSYLFYKCTGLSLVNFGNSLTSVSAYAFSDCSKLTAAILPSTLKSIGDYAFNGCSSITQVNLGSATSVGSYAFSDNTSLAHVVMSPYLKTISYYAFRSTTNLNDIELPNTLTSIGENAFASSGITSADIPASVTSIGSSAFAGAKIKSLTLGLSDITLGSSAFSSCTSLKTVNILNQQTSISESCFSGCTALTDISLGEGLTTIGQSAFDGCAKMESISIPASVTQIGEYKYSNYYPNVSSNRDYYYSTFKGCYNLKKIRFEDGTSTLKLGYTYYSSSSSYGRGMFADCSIEEIYLGRNISYIDTNYKFSTSNANNFGYSAFYNQTNLTSVTIGSKVTSLPDYLFYQCSGLNTVIDINNTAATLQSTSFSIYTPTLYVPKAALSTYTSASYWSKFTNIQGMLAENDLLFIPQADNSLTVTKYPGASPEQVVVPETVTDETGTFNVTKVMDGAFKSCDDLTLVSLPSTVTEVGENAFAYNQKLASLTFNGQKIIGKGAFRNCPSITSLSLPNSLEEIGDQAFYKNTSITSISFGDGLKTIGSQAFAECSALTAIKLPAGVETINQSAFENCIKLTYATLGSSLKDLASRAFYNCKVLTEIAIPGTVTTVGQSAFEKCTNLTLATLESGTVTLSENTFKDCESLLTLSVPASVTTIGNGSFDGCKSLSSVSFAAGEDQLKIANFQDSPLKTVRIGRNLVYDYGKTSSPFRNLTTISRVSFTGNYVTELYYNLFDGCSGITSITLPSSLLSIRDRAFQNCTGITAITLPSSLQTIWYSAFKGCSNLASITLPSSLQIVWDEAFKDCTNLSTVTILEGLQTISNYVFENCNKLGAISLPSSVKTVGDGCFDLCSSLKDVTFVDGQDPITLSSEHSLFRDAPLEKLYVGRNIDYSYTSSQYVPFYNKELLTDVTISDQGGVTYLKDYFLYGASSLKSLVVPDNVKTIGIYAFANCSSLESISLSTGLSILNTGLLQNDVALKSLIISPNITEVYNYVLGNCTALTDLTIQDSSSELKANISASGKGMCAETALENLYIGRNINYTATSTYGYSPFYGLKTLKSVSFTTKGYVTRCDNYYLNGCSAVATLYLPESLVTVGDYAFMGMTSLEYCRMYNNVETVGKYGFANDESLDDLTFSTKVKTLTNNLFQNCYALPRFTVHPAVTSIEDNAFLNTTSLSTLSFTDSSDLLNIGRRNVDSGISAMFADSPLQSVYLSRWLIYNIDDETYAPFYNQTGLTDLRFGETLGDIGKYLFEKCSAVESVNIPGVESIGQKSFYECSALSTLTLNEGTRSIGEQTFSECTSLKNVKLPGSVVSVSDGSFMNDINLTTLDLGNSLEIIGPSAFSGCTSLQELVLPKTVYGLGVESFKECTSLPYLTIPDGCALSSIGARSFQGCTGLKWLSLSSNITSIGANAFDGCTSIQYVKSFNTTPPVGLPNFAQTVLDNATLFVPTDVIDDYKDADVWWEFFDIRGIGDGVFITYLNIDKEEATIKAAETVQINAEVGPEDATNREVGYLSDNMDVATVDENGVVTAIAVGEANIKAYAKDGSGYYKTCKITVVPTLMESLTMNETTLSIKVNRTGQLTADVLPATTTNKSIVWRSSNSSIVSVDENGELTSRAKGTATITATAADGSGIVASCVVTVLPPTVGDSNDNDEVTITDAVNTANYAVGNNVDNFCFEAADVNGDNRITLADASGTITEVLNQPVQSKAMSVRRLSRGNATIDLDNLIIDDYNCNTGKTDIIEVKLDNTIDYVALQADISVPEGMTLVDVESGTRSDANHSLMKRCIDNNTTRIALFNLDNAVFADNDEAIIRLKVKVDNANCGDIVMSNILAADSSANEYVLTSTGGHNLNLSGIGAIYGDGNISIVASTGEITVYNAEGKNIRIFTLDGTMVADITAVTNAESRKLVNGMYIISAGNTVAKVFVK